MPKGVYEKTEDHKRKSGERFRQLNISRTGIKRSPEVIESVRQGILRRERSTFVRGEKHYKWRGGITPLNHKIRASPEYKLWRKSVFERDNYTCIWCGMKSIAGLAKAVILHADHIKPFAWFPELRFDINNGRTLCIECHKKTDTYSGKSRCYTLPKKRKTK